MFSFFNPSARVARPRIATRRTACKVPAISNLNLTNLNMCAIVTTEVVTTIEQELAGLLGLTDYEARAYVALVREGALTSYAVAKASGIPVSKSYEAVEGLARKGGAVLLPGTPNRHSAVPPDTLLTGARQRYSTALESLSAALADLPAHAEQDVPALWQAALEAGLAQTAARVGASQRTVVGALPFLGREALESSLADAARRGVLVQVVSSGDESLTLLLDDREAILASAQAPGAEVIGSGNPALVALCRMRLRGASASPFLRPSEDVAQWLRWEEEKGLRLLKTS